MRKHCILLAAVLAAAAAPRPALAFEAGVFEELPLIANAPENNPNPQPMQEVPLIANAPQDSQGDDPSKGGAAMAMEELPLLPDEAPPPNSSPSNSSQANAGPPKNNSIDPAKNSTSNVPPKKTSSSSNSTMKFIKLEYFSSKDCATDTWYSTQLFPTNSSKNEVTAFIDCASLPQEFPELMKCTQASDDGDKQFFKTSCAETAEMAITRPSTPAARIATYERCEDAKTPGSILQDTAIAADGKCHPALEVGAFVRADCAGKKLVMCMNSACDKDCVDVALDGGCSKPKGSSVAYSGVCPGDTKDGAQSSSGAASRGSDKRIVAAFAGGVVTAAMLLF